MKHGGTLIGKRLYKGLRSRVIVPTVDNNPPVVVKVLATMGERHYAEKLEEIERKVKDGSYGGSKTTRPQAEPLLISRGKLWACPFARSENNYVCLGGPTSVKAKPYRPVEKCRKESVMRHLALAHGAGAKCEVIEREAMRPFVGVKEFEWFVE